MGAPNARTPFAFRELSAATPEDEVITYTKADLEQARLDGIVEGRALAASSIAEMDRQTLQAIEISLGEAAHRFSEGLAHERGRLAQGAAAFLDHFCTALARDRELEAARAMIEQLLQHSVDRSPAVLRLSPASLSRLSNRIEALIRGSGASDFLCVESDGSLEVGECRIEWRGGALEKSQINITRAVDALFRAPAEEDAHDET